MYRFYVIELFGRYVMDSINGFVWTDDLQNAHLFTKTELESYSRIEVHNLIVYIQHGMIRPIQIAKV